MQGDHSDLNVIEYVCALCPDIAKDKVYQKLIEFGFAVRKKQIWISNTPYSPWTCTHDSARCTVFFLFTGFLCFLQEDKKSPACIHSNITGLSGGWKMKLGNKIWISFFIQNLQRTAYIRAKSAPQHIHALNRQIFLAYRRSTSTNLHASICCAADLREVAKLSLGLTLLYLLSACSTCFTHSLCLLSIR